MSDYLFDGDGPPDPEIEKLERQLRVYRAPPPPTPIARPFPVRAIVTGAVALAAAAAAAFVMLRPEAPSWRVDPLAGAPRCGERACAELRPGEWLETGRHGRVSVQVADIGRMEVGPDTRLQLVRTANDGHRLALARGEISANVVAPPRLLVVDTPAAEAVDLGCAYTLRVDDDGVTRLRVTNGWVALERERGIAYVSAGFEAIVRRGEPPGVPVFADAEPSFRSRVSEIEMAGNGASVATVRELVDASSPNDALTLWHLVPRVAAGEARELVVRAIADSSPLPAGTSRESVLQAEPRALEAWREAYPGW